MPERSAEPGVDPVLRPKTVVELSAIFEEASRSGRSTYLRGGRTHERFANVGPRTDSIVDMTGLNDVIEYSPVDLTLAVQCGVRLEEIDKLLAENNQRLALDMPHRSMATIGGAFASGLSGPRRLRYGSLKDTVIGAEVVNCEGEVSRSGGMVVKNVSGYELARLHYGAHGAFGAVSRLNLKVLPAVESRAEARCYFASPSDSLEAAASVLISSLDPAAVYVTKSPSDQWTLHVQIEGNDRFTGVQREQIVEHVAGVRRPRGYETVELTGRSTPAFDAIADLLDADSEIVSRFSVPASQQAGVLERLGNLDEWDVLADAGSGLIYVRAEARSDTVDALAKLDVPVVYLSIPETMKSGLDVFGSMNRASATIVSRLKDQYDPGRIFNPGRFVSFL